MIPTVEWPTKAKEAPPQEVRLIPLDTNPVFQCLGLYAYNSINVTKFCHISQFEIEASFPDTMLHFRIQCFISGIKALI